MASAVKESMFGLFPAFSIVSMIGVTACLLALCMICRRKGNNRMAPQDDVMLVEASLLRQPELSPLRESTNNVEKLSRANSKRKDQPPASMNIPYSLNKDDGTVSSSSFIILPQRDLPQIPSVDLLSPEQTYSNLSFLSPAQEMLYESVTVTGDEREEPNPAVEEPVPKEDWSASAEYAQVLKAKRKKDQPAMEAGASRAAAMQEPSPAGTVLSSPQTVLVEEMYSVVCKGRKKKSKDSAGQSEEQAPQGKSGQGNGQVAAARQESDGRAGCPSSLFRPSMIEPCYESVNCGSWVDVGQNGKQAPEPAYETVDTHWKRPKRTGKSIRNNPAENLYESIENLALQLPNQHAAASSLKM